jgi:hypothetical protein
LSRNNSSGSATTGIWYQSYRFTFTIGTKITAAPKNVFRIKNCLTKEFAKCVGLVKVGA